MKDIEMLKQVNDQVVISIDEPIYQSVERFLAVMSAQLELTPQQIKEALDFPYLAKRQRRLAFALLEEYEKAHPYQAGMSYERYGEELLQAHPGMQVSMIEAYFTQKQISADAGEAVSEQALHSDVPKQKEDSASVAQEDQPLLQKEETPAQKECADICRSSAPQAQASLPVASPQQEQRETAETTALFADEEHVPLTQEVTGTGQNGCAQEAETEKRAAAASVSVHREQGEVSKDEERTTHSRQKLAARLRTCGKIVFWLCLLIGVWLCLSAFFNFITSPLIRYYGIGYTLSLLLWQIIIGAGIAFGGYIVVLALNALACLLDQGKPQIPFHRF